ncbi:tyrosine-protein phosphatase [Streptomyces fagopyri]|uniref:tyrosine-protein phosphatase n=1 Tax=Streptomyces fagopyri TaxID=2662397 RepID=UPI0037FE976D
MDGPDANRPIPFARLHNFRDLGGYTTPDGRTVRRSRLYRADSLGKLALGTQDWDLFLTLGIRTVVDLRHPGEIEAKGRPAGRSPTATTSGSRAGSPNPTSAPASRRARSG